MSSNHLDRLTLRLLSDEQILSAYDRVAALYPHIPSLSMWRAWEYAAYRGYRIEAPVLDVGCGDGRWFQLVWPEVQDVSGIDMDADAVARARQSGVYRQVWQADAAALPEEARDFATVFANCSLEHMDNIEQVMANVYAALRPGGQFIFSIVTEQVQGWFSPGALARAWGDAARAEQLYQDWLGYHHLVNPFSIERWQEALIEAGFEVVEQVPIISEMHARLFLLLDSLWHTPRGTGEVGDALGTYLRATPNFPQGFRSLLEGALRMERDRAQGCGAVLVARKPGGATLPAPLADEGLAANDENLRSCWCGSRELLLFSPDYRRCTRCGTLVSQAGLAPEQLAVRDDEQAFYGKQYWLSYQQRDLGLPDIFQRARSDLPERCLYWLRTLLRYTLPPARVLELGAAHGGFVAMLRWAGFEATGLELSQWVVEFARETFDVPMLLGPVEQQHLAPGSLDAIVLNDVLEHLPDPEGTMRFCAHLLKPEGLLVVQTPCYRGQSYAALRAESDPFLEHVEHTAEQHLFLFSEQAARLLFSSLGFEFMAFEPPIFGYDMFFVASRQAPAQHDAAAITAALVATPGGRLVQALLDKDDEARQLRQQWQAAEADRSARWQVIEGLEAQLRVSEADRAARLQAITFLQSQLDELHAQLELSEADRAARLQAIDYLKAQLMTSSQPAE